MAKEPERHRDRDPECKDEPQPKRAFDLAKDYFNLRRFRMDFGREFNATNYWGDKEKRQ